MSATALLATLYGSVRASEWQIGDVFTGASAPGIERGYLVWDPAGTIKDELIYDNPEPETSGSGMTGCVCDGGGNLIGTAFEPNHVVVFDRLDPHSVLRDFSTFGVWLFPDGGNESLALDQSGNLYVGHAGRAGTSSGAEQLHRYTQFGTLLEEYACWTEERGTDWIDLAVDQRTMFYTSEGRSILRYDVVSRTQLPDFAVLPGILDNAFAVRLLPPGDGSGGLLVADRSDIKRLNANGDVIHIYGRGSGTIFGLALDPDGTTFWACKADRDRDCFRFNIETGAVLNHLTEPVPRMTGAVCVLGEYRAADPCGNGVLEFDEQCDDRNKLPGDGCDQTCQYESSPCLTGAELPEASRRSLRVHRDREDLVISFDTAVIPFLADSANLYRGTIAAFSALPNYDHTKLICDLTEAPFIDSRSGIFGSGSFYYLANFSCRNPYREGTLGNASDGTPRPSAGMLGLSPCP